MAPRLRLPFKIPYLRIFYSTTYTSLFILELALLGITPVSMIYSAISERALQYIVIVGGVYVLTALFVLFIYSSRLYTNRTVLAALGKGYIPIEDGEVSKSLRKLIKGQLDKSNTVALECRPRNLAEAEPVPGGPEPVAEGTQAGSRYGRLARVDASCPPWGFISHPGWSSPNANETSVAPHVHFMQIISELPNLLEAQIVSLGGPPRASDERATTQPEYPDPQNTPPLPSIREYLDLLDAEEYAVVPESASEFIDRFEQARFSGRPLSEHDFVALTSGFANLLSRIEVIGAGNDSGASVGNETMGNGILPTIEDGGSVMSAPSRPTTLQSSQASATTVNMTDDSETRDPFRISGTHGRSGSVFRTSIYSSLESSRHASAASIDSAASVIGRAQVHHQRRERM